jgi:hypothetical protein
VLLGKKRSTVVGVAHKVLMGRPDKKLMVGLDSPRARSEDKYLSISGLYRR